MKAIEFVYGYQTFMMFGVNMEEDITLVSKIGEFPKSFTSEIEKFKTQGALKTDGKWVYLFWKSDKPIKNDEPIDILSKIYFNPENVSHVIPLEKFKNMIDTGDTKLFQSRTKKDLLHFYNDSLEKKFGLIYILKDGAANRNDLPKTGYELSKFENISL